MLGDPAATRGMAPSSSPVLSVSALNRSIRDLLEHRYPLVWVAGEISNFTPARSGHVYFSLKDHETQVRCVMFRSRSSLLGWQVRDGMQVEVRAVVTLYEPRGEFQLNVEFMRRAGLGALYEAFVRLRDRLAGEGLFDPAAKRALPPYPRAIGVVTSLAAAALRDVVTTLARRSPGIPVIVYPAAVQGENAPAAIVAALRAAARRAECEVLILCRGGGSIEDLWPFNDEGVARAIRTSPIPIVVGVGHETDVTIADYAADVRAPTPTAAAELASPLCEELRYRVARLVERLHRCGRHHFESRMQRIDQLARRLVHPGRRLDIQGAAVARLAARLDHAVVRSLERRQWQVQGLVARVHRRAPPIDRLTLRLATLVRQFGEATHRVLMRREARLDALGASLTALDPHAVLARGYSIVRKTEGAVVRAAAEVAAGDGLDITFASGSADARVERVRVP